MQYSKEIQQGWEFATATMGTNIATNIGEEYVRAVENAIRQLEDNINNHQYRNLGIKQLQGFMLEEWSSGTFNIDAIAASSSDRSSVLHSTLLDSVDVELNSGKTYSAKSYATSSQTAKEQARLNLNTRQASYRKQGRLVPSDQLEDAKAIARLEKQRNEFIREDVSKAYANTEKKLTDRISNKEGIESKSVSRKELEKIARESKERVFKAEEHCITTKSAIKPEYLLKCWIHYSSCYCCFSTCSRDLQSNRLPYQKWRN